MDAPVRALLGERYRDLIRDIFSDSGIKLAFHKSIKRFPGYRRHPRREDQFFPICADRLCALEDIEKIGREGLYCGRKDAAQGHAAVCVQIDAEPWAFVEWVHALFLLLSSVCINIVATKK